MPSVSRYSSVGPFHGVPEEARARVAAAANAAASKAVAAAIRTSRETGDECYEHDAVFQGLPKLNALGDRNRQVNRTTRSEGWFKAVFIVGLLGLFGTVPFMMASDYMSVVPDSGDRPLVIAGLACAALWVLAVVVAWFSGLRDIADIRRQGFVRDRLPDAAARRASVCWLLGERSVQIAEFDDELEVKTVFYDAIGVAKVTIDGDGLERVEITGRDGAELAAIVSPEGQNVASAHHLAKTLTEYAAASRKAA